MGIRVGGTSLEQAQAKGGDGLPVSLQEARKRIFGHWTSAEVTCLKFDSLKKLRRRGWIGPKVADYHPEPHPLQKHPIYRKVMNDKRLAELQARKAAGRVKPKKGEGKAAKRKK